MTCTITYITSREPGIDERPLHRGTLPTRSVQWTVSAWLITPGGEKATHSMTIPACLPCDLIPAVGERIDALAEENGNICTQFGWTASAHGGTKQKGKKKGGKRR